MPDELTKSLLLEEALPRSALAEALFVSVMNRVPLPQALTESGALEPQLLVRYLARAAAPFLRQVVPAQEIVDLLPPGLCERLLVVPVRRDPTTGTVDVAVVDAIDEHAARELAFHLGSAVRVVRASPSALEEALRTLRPRPSAARAARDWDEELYDSRPRSRRSVPPASARGLGRAAHDTDAAPPGSTTDPSMDVAALRPPPAPRAMHTAPPPAGAAGRPRKDTPTWGTPVHAAGADPSEPPKGAPLGSEIPIPLTRKTYSAVAGGTQRPPPMAPPDGAGLGEGYAVDPASFRTIVEVRAELSDAPPDSLVAHSFFPGAPPLPPPPGVFSPHAPQLAFADIGAILVALRAAGSRDEVLELVLTGARTLAFKVALFVAKRGGFLGWACTPEFGDRSAVQAVLVPLDGASVFDLAAREGLYLGPIREDPVHAALLATMRGPSRDVAVVPIRVAGKVVVVIVADELGDTMHATRRLEELATAAGDAFTRIVRTRR